MSNRNRYKNAKGKRDPGGFVAIPYDVLLGDAFRGLSAYGVKFVMDLASQYRGDNNGDLCAAWKVMKLRGWKSEATLHKYKMEALESGLVCETRKGARPNKCSLYALTWFALDECGGKLDITSRSFPRGAYRFKDPLPPIGKNSRLNTECEVEGAG